MNICLRRSVFAVLFFSAFCMAFCAPDEQKPVAIGTEVEASDSAESGSPLHQAEAPAVDGGSFSQKGTDNAEVIDIDLSEDAEDTGSIAQKDKPYRGWKIQDSPENEGANVVKIATFDGKTASINIGENADIEKILKPVGRALDAAWQLPGMKAEKAAVYADDPTHFRLVIFPTSFVYKDINLCEYLPSGIAFSYDSSLLYDVVLKVGDLMPRVTGIFVSEKELAELLYNAAVTPDVYMYDDNLVARVERLEKALLALAPKAMYSKPYEIDPGLIQIIKKLYSENNNITKKEVTAWLKQQKIKYSQSDIDTIFVVLLGVYE